MSRLRGTAWGEGIDDGRTNLRSSATAILQEKHNNVAGSFEVGAIDNRTTMSLCGDKAGPRKHSNVR
jgi:hypothetical protein